MYKNYLFDLDGTLLPMDMREFIKLYFGSLSKKMSPLLGIEPEVLVNAVWKGTAAMAANDGTSLNSAAFWRAASEECGTELMKYESRFNDYYENEFIAAKRATSANEAAKKSVEYIKSIGGRIIVATNPIFPKIATEKRLIWAGLNADDFDYISTYENSTCCKPNLLYYQELCEKCGIAPEESIMIGNDVDEDMCSSKLGFDTYLIKDCIINRKNRDYSMYKNGSFDDFYNFLIIG